MNVGVGLQMLKKISNRRIMNLIRTGKNDDRKNTYFLREQKMNGWILQKKKAGYH